MRNEYGGRGENPVRTDAFSALFFFSEVTQPTHLDVGKATLVAGL